MRLPHVAITTFGYPPIPHVCGTRAASMAARLVALGHDVTIVTIDWRADHTAPPETPVPRVIRIDPRPWHPDFRVDRPPFTTEAPASRNAVAAAFHAARAMVAWGPYASWARAALAALVDVHQRHPVDVVWAIHGDDSSHEIAFRFHRITGTPWVADFKDPWNLFHRERAWPLQWLATWRRVRTAVAVTETSRAQAERDARFGRPTHVIWSGYDSDLMSSAPSSRRSPEFRIIYTGHVAPLQHDEDAIARLLQQWKKARGASAGGVQIQFYGTNSALLRAALERRGVGDLVRFHSFVDRSEVFAMLKSADVLVLLPATNWSPSGGSVGMKELEYFASGTPVLCLGRLLDEMRAAAGPQVFEALDDVSAVRFLGEEFDAFHASAPSARREAVNAPIIARHSWHVRAAELSRLLSDAAKTGHRSSQ